MPNWSFNRMQVRASNDLEAAEVKRLRDFIKRTEKDKDGELYTTPFSFQNVIPMPDELDIPAKSFADENCDEAEELRKKEQANLEKYGFKDWYDWRWKKWGTKWDACDVEDESEGDDLIIKFDTAWSFPTPIALELSRLFPTLTFTYDAEEESGEYDFEVEFKDGKVVAYFEWEHDEEGCRTIKVSKPVECF